MQPVETRPCTTVRHFRQILLWPLQLLTASDGRSVQRPWEELSQRDEGAPWTEVTRELRRDPEAFKLRHYAEFITFLPIARRFLYGEGGDSDDRAYGESPIRVFRRSDLARVRLTLDPKAGAVELAVDHCYLFFFYDIDVVILAVETCGDDLPLGTVQEILFRFGRSYPAFWEADGRGGNCMVRVEWVSPEGEVVARSDYEDQARYLSYTARNRAAAVSADWTHIMEPLVPHPERRDGALRYRQLEYLRMPLMAYLAVDDPRALTRADFVRLAFATRSGGSDSLPFSARSLNGFEERHCYDSFWGLDDPQAANTRFLCTGNTFLVVGDARQRFFTDPENGVLAQFRHQYFLLGLISHFHKAALLGFRERLMKAVSRLDIRDSESIKGFKRDIRLVAEIFLRFTHRYWFHEVSLQAPAKPLFAMWRSHLGTAELYDEIRREVQDMAQYLDSDGLRRQANTVVRLTVVTIAGLIATITSGFLGMNLIDAADEPFAARLLYLLVVFVAAAIFTFWAVLISKRLSDFLEVLSDARLPLKAKLIAFLRVFTARSAPSRRS